MKTKVVQHVPRNIFNVFKVFKFSGFQIFKYSNRAGSQLKKNIDIFNYKQRLLIDMKTKVVQHVPRNIISICHVTYDSMTCEM